MSAMACQENQEAVPTSTRPKLFTYPYPASCEVFKASSEEDKEETSSATCAGGVTACSTHGAEGAADLKAGEYHRPVGC